jgi:hypothetical protein
MKQDTLTIVAMVCFGISIALMIYMGDKIVHADPPYDHWAIKQDERCTLSAGITVEDRVAQTIECRRRGERIFFEKYEPAKNRHK